LADEQTHRFLARDPFHDLLIEQGSVAERGDRELQDFLIEWSLASEMIVIAA